MSKKEKVHVLQMISSLYFGGSQTMIVNLFEKIDRNDIQFAFIIDHDEHNEYREKIEELGGLIYVMPTFKGINYFAVRRAWNDFFNKHPEYKILHSHSRSYASIYLPIAKKHHLKTIIHSHNTSNGTGIKALIKNALQYPLRYIADYYFACSTQAGKWLFGDDIVNKDNFYVLNNAIDVDKFKYNYDIRSKYRKEFNLKDEKVFIQVASFSRQKNHAFSISLFSKIKEIYPDAKMYFVGLGDLATEIKKQIEDYNLQDSIILLGSRNDVNNLLQMADYYIMPSTYEGLSVAAIEAQSSGIKCLLSDQVSSDVKISDNCYLLPLEEDVWLKEIKKDFSRNKDAYKNTIKSGFDINTTAKWLKEFYQRIV